jgi:hypothetical protein
MIVIGVIECTWRSMSDIDCEMASFAISYTGFSSWKLASISVESDRTLRIIIFESFRFWKAEAQFGWRVIGEMFLYILVTNQRDFIHLVNFIMKMDK